MGVRTHPNIQNSAFIKTYESSYLHLATFSYLSGVVSIHQSLQAPVIDVIKKYRWLEIKYFKSLSESYSRNSAPIRLHTNI